MQQLTDLISWISCMRVRGEKISYSLFFIFLLHARIQLFQLLTPPTQDEAMMFECRSEPVLQANLPPKKHQFSTNVQ